MQNKVTCRALQPRLTHLAVTTFSLGLIRLPQVQIHGVRPQQAAQEGRQEGVGEVQVQIQVQAEIVVLTFLLVKALQVLRLLGLHIRARGAAPRTHPCFGFWRLVVYVGLVAHVCVEASTLAVRLW